MRLGKDKKVKSWPRAGEKAKPNKVSPESIVGHLSPDLITYVYAPRIRELATRRLEQYAEELLAYQETLDQRQNATKTSQAEIDVDGSIRADAEDHHQIPPMPPRPPLFSSEHRLNEFSSSMKEISDHFLAKTGGWRIQANAARFERLLDEKYGIFRPLITQYPELELLLRSVQRRIAMGYLSPFRHSEPPLAKSTSIILLVMMQRGGVKWDVLLLSGLFLLVGLQPWALVLLVAVSQTTLRYARQRPIGTMKRRIPAVTPYYHRDGSTDRISAILPQADTDRYKHEILLRPVGTPLGSSDSTATTTAASSAVDTSKYDVLVLGTGAETLYTAAVLSRAGRRVCVISADFDASGCIQLTDSKLEPSLTQIPFDVTFSNMSKISKQQEMLALALCTTSDFQGGVRFAQIGSSADGFAFEILSIPGVGTDDPTHETPMVLRAAGGLSSFMADAAEYLGDGWPGDGDVGSSTCGSYVGACEAMNQSAGAYYLTKLLSERWSNVQKASTYQEASIRHASSFLDQCFPLNAHVRSFMAGIGMKGESIQPKMTSMAPHITNVCAALSGEGMHYPVGGPRALCHALANVVEKSGGRIVTDAEINSLVFHERPMPANAKEPPAPYCVGVQLSNGQEIVFDKNRFEGKSQPTPAVVSMLGFINTFIRLLPPDIRTKYKVPRGLPALAEQRPLLHCLFLLKGKATDLELTGADYYRLPNAARALDELDPHTGEARLGEIGWSHYAGGHEQGADEKTENVVERANQDSVESQKGNADSKRRKKRNFQFENGASWMKISFPSAKDPSFESRHEKYSTCVVTIEADDDFVQPFDTSPKIFQPKKHTSSTPAMALRLLDRVSKDLLNIYPQLEGKIAYQEIHGPVTRGLSHTPERYAAKGVRSDTPYPGLFLGGSDLTVGENFSAAIVGGWLAANAVVGYSDIDLLFLGKNITTDLARFLVTPNASDEEDIAVPYTAANGANLDLSSP